MSRQVVRFGTRGSALARAQTDLVIDRLKALHPEFHCEVVIIQTEGDRDKETPLTVIGGRGVFTNALQDALRTGEIDVAVHSAKDLPTEGMPDLKIAAFLERADPRDVFVSRHGLPLTELGPNPVIGTSSRRRQVQVRKLRPDAQLVDLRGNIDTRLRKAFETELDGIVLAAAGIERMGWSDRITQYLPLDVAVPSPGQGALAVEIRADESGPAAKLVDLDDPAVSIPVKVERAFLRGTGAGCTSPVGAHASLEAQYVSLQVMLSRSDGSATEWTAQKLGVERSEESAFALAQTMIAFLSQPLAKKRVLVTRGDPTNSTRTKLSIRGAAPVMAPVTRIEPLGSLDLDRALSGVSQPIFDWVVFTSKNGVDALLNSPVGAEIVKNASIAAVGAATSAYLVDHGIQVESVPSCFNSDFLVAELAKRNFSGKRVLFPRGDLAKQTVPEGLKALGATVEVLTVYRTLVADELEPDVLTQIADEKLDAVMLFSPSGVHALKKLTGDHFSKLKGATVACIGRTTALAAREAGLKVEIVAEESTIDGLIDALEKHFAEVGAEPTELVAVGQSGEGGPNA